MRKVVLDTDILSEILKGRNAIVLASEILMPELSDFETVGRIRGLARQRGTQLTWDDCLIGAIAARVGLSLATGKTGHFAAMQAVGLHSKSRTGASVSSRQRL